MGDKHCGCEYCGSTDFNCNHCSADFSTAELAAELGQCLDCCKRVGELEEQLAECQRERDALREAVQDFITAWDNDGASEPSEVNYESAVVRGRRLLA